LRGDDRRVEAVSNGVTAFKEPRSKNANRTLTVIIGILIHSVVRPELRGTGVWRDRDGSGRRTNYQSVLSIEVAAVFGRGWFYFLTMGGVLAALSFSANTAFADFPRMARAIAGKDYLPHVFLLRGRRLLFSHGIYALTGLTALILDPVQRRDGPVDPAVCHWRVPGVHAEPGRHGEALAQDDMDAPHRHLKMFVNGLGSRTATACRLLRDPVDEVHLRVPG
jgi:hypothetical protein